MTQMQLVAQSLREFYLKGPVCRPVTATCAAAAKSIHRESALLLMIMMMDLISHQHESALVHECCMSSC